MLENILLINFKIFVIKIIIYVERWIFNGLENKWKKISFVIGKVLFCLFLRQQFMTISLYFKSFLDRNSLINTLLK